MKRNTAVIIQCTTRNLVMFVLIFFVPKNHTNSDSALGLKEKGDLTSLFWLIFEREKIREHKGSDL